MPIRILLADDHFMFREMLRDTLRHKGEGHEIVGEAANGVEIFTLLARYHPDLLLLDYKMPGLGRLSTFCQEVACYSPTTRVLVVSGYTEQETVLEAAVGGAYGYICKGAPIASLLSAIATIQAGRIWVDPSLPSQVFHAFLSRRGDKVLSTLTRQELHILSLVAQGMSNWEVSTHLHLSQKTVKNHLTHIFAKLGVTSRQEAARYLYVRKKGTD